MFKLDSLNSLNLKTKKNSSSYELEKTLKFLKDKLEEKTEGVISSKIEKIKFLDDGDYDMTLDFYLVAPELKNLKYRLFSIHYSLKKAFPVLIEFAFLTDVDQGYLCPNIKTLEEQLNEIFTYDEVSNILTSLYQESIDK